MSEVGVKVAVTVSKLKEKTSFGFGIAEGVGKEIMIHSDRFLCKHKAERRIVFESLQVEDVVYGILREWEKGFFIDNIFRVVRGEEEIFSKLCVE